MEMASLGNTVRRESRCRVTGLSWSSQSDRKADWVHAFGRIASVMQGNGIGVKGGKHSCKTIRYVTPECGARACSPSKGSKCGRLGTCRETWYPEMLSVRIRERQFYHQHNSLLKKGEGRKKKKRRNCKKTVYHSWCWFFNRLAGKENVCCNRQSLVLYRYTGRGPLANTTSSSHCISFWVDGRELSMM